MRVSIEFSQYEPREATKTKFDALVRAIGLDSLESYLEELLGEVVTDSTLNDTIQYEFDDICNAFNLDCDEILCDEETIEDMDPEEGLFKNEALNEIAKRIDLMVEQIENEFDVEEDEDEESEDIDEDIVWKD